MLSISSAASTLAVAVPLAILLMLALPSGAAVQIVMHTILLVAGAALVLALHPQEKSD
ncbi:MAG: hypothetical protein HOV81_22560 [Kofleriaceae bacterium]|nr:hypothetical protein [Kofleriaceae bacterium]